MPTKKPEQPVVEAPVVEAPVVEAPVVEAPVIYKKAVCRYTSTLPNGDHCKAGQVIVYPEDDIAAFVAAGHVNDDPAEVAYFESNPA